MHQLGVFKTLSKAQGPLTAQQLGEQTGGDPLLIGEHPIFTSHRRRAMVLTDQLA